MKNATKLIILIKRNKKNATEVNNVNAIRSLREKMGGKAGMYKWLTVDRKYGSSIRLKILLSSALLVVFTASHARARLCNEESS